MNDRLPEGYICRGATLDDADAMTEVILACDQAIFGEANWSREDMLAELQKPRLNLATDTWVAVAPDGRIVAYTDVWDRSGAHVRVFPKSGVHPEHCGRGIGSYLLAQVEDWTRRYWPQAHPDAPAVITPTIRGGDEAARRLMEEHGYTPGAVAWAMRIDMEEPPPAPAWPAGITARAFIPGRDERALHAAMQDAFSQNDGFVATAFEDWVQVNMGHPDFDPTLYTLAMEGDEVAGAVTVYTMPEGGWVDQLAVRQPWRGRGLGMALLRHALGECYRRDRHTVELTVNSQNPSAVRLYERAGMHVAWELDWYHKEIRDG